MLLYQYDKIQNKGALETMNALDQQIEELLQQSSVQYTIYKENQDTERMEKLHLFARKLLQ